MSRTLAITMGITVTVPATIDGNLKSAGEDDKGTLLVTFL